MWSNGLTERAAVTMRIAAMIAAAAPGLSLLIIGAQIHDVKSPQATGLIINRPRCLQPGYSFA
jgi:hypothetical protein